MKIKKNFLRGEEMISSHTDCLSHLSWEEIFEYLEHRYELSLDDPLKKRVLYHIIECRQCHNIFSYAHNLMIAIETDSIPESTEESKQKAYDIVLHAPSTESVLEEAQEITAVSQEIEESTQIERLIGRLAEDFSTWLISLFKPHPPHRFAVAVANPVGLQLRIRLLEKAREILQYLGYQTAPPQTDLLHTYLDLNENEHINAQGDREARFLLDGAKFINLAEALANTPGHIIVTGRLQEWQIIGNEAMPNRFYAVHLSDDDRRFFQRAAVQYYEAIAETPDILEPVRRVLALGAFGVLTPISLLASVVREPVDILVERLNDTRVSPLVMPINPTQITVPDPAKASFFTATSELMAAAALDSAGLFTEDTLTNTFSELVGVGLSGSDKSPDEKTIHIATIVRLLYSLSLNSRQQLARNLIEQYSGALRVLQESITDAHHLHTWAKIYRSLGSIQACTVAEELYKRALKIEPENIYLKHAYATFLAEQRNFSEAEQLFQEIRERGKADNVYVLTAWAKMKQRRLRLDEASKMLQKAHEIEPNNPYPLQMLGLLEAEQRHFTQANIHFEQALKVDANNIPTLHAQGHLAREQGQLRKAEELLKKVLEMDASNVHTLVELGRVYSERFELGEREAEQKARDCFQKALEIDRGNVLALTALTDLDIEASDFDEIKTEALESRLEEAEKIARDRNIDRAPIITTRAKMAMKKEDNQQAEELLESLRRSDNIVALNLLVKLYWEKGDKERARELFKEIRQRELTPRILNNFAKLLVEVGEFVEAEDWYLQSLDIDEENAYTQLGYGCLLLDWAEEWEDEDTRREMLKAASEAIHKADELGLDVPKTKKALERL